MLSGNHANQTTTICSIKCIRSQNHPMPKNPEERTDENKQNSGLLDLKNPNTASSNCTFNEICSDEKAEDVEEDLNQAIWYKALFVYVPIQLF